MSDVNPNDEPWLFDDELASLRARLAKAEREKEKLTKERDQWLEAAHNLSQSGTSRGRFVEIYGPKLGKINTTAVIRSESARANAAEAELAKAREALAKDREAARPVPARAEVLEEAATFVRNHRGISYKSYGTKQWRRATQDELADALRALKGEKP